MATEYNFVCIDKCISSTRAKYLHLKPIIILRVFESLNYFSNFLCTDLYLRCTKLWLEFICSYKGYGLAVLVLSIET